MSRRDKVYEALRGLQRTDNHWYTTEEIAEEAGISRNNCSTELNYLVKEGRVKKKRGRPVLYSIAENVVSDDQPLRVRILDKSLPSFDNLIGTSGSLASAVEQAKAACIYPPHGLPTLIVGPTGVGKSLFAELMYNYSREAGVISKNAPFVTFNCADFANNKELLMAHLFGSSKGAYTGADSDRPGLVEKANGGVLFLDEVHRLPPEGQEMLFYLMDKDEYRRLGETALRKASIMIVAATTEDPTSLLLATFLRRIPVVISLPALAERPIEERLELVKDIVSIESERIGSPIDMVDDAMKAFLVYQCSGNIGQLKNDIQVSVAKAFLKYKTGIKDRLIITTDELPIHVKNSLLNIDSRRDIQRVLREADKRERISVHGIDFLKTDFYEKLEDRIEKLKSQNYQDDDIEKILDIEIESYYNQLSIEFKKNLGSEALKKLIDPSLYTIIDDIVDIVSNSVENVSERLYYAIFLHINSLFERLKGGKTVINSHLTTIKKKYADEYKIAEKMVELLNNKFPQFKIPDDEAGFLAAILGVLGNMKSERWIGVAVIAHGDTTASSMARVANTLLGVDFVRAIDMPLDMSPELALEKAVNMVLSLDAGRGCLLLVDMGSLTTFADIIKKRTGIDVEVIDMVSTSIVIEAARKAMMPEVTLKELKDAICEHIPYVRKGKNRIKSIGNGKYIVTSCITGEGTASNLKNMIDDFLHEKGYTGIEVVAVSGLDGDTSHLKDSGSVIAVVGSMDLGIGVPFIPLEEIVAGNGFEALESILNEGSTIVTEENVDEIPRHRLIDYIRGVLDEYLTFVNPGKALNSVLNSIDFIENKLSFKMNNSIIVKFSVHACCMIERLMLGNLYTYYNDKEDVKLRFPYEYSIFKESMQIIEADFGIKIPEDEVLYLLGLCNFAVL